MFDHFAMEEELAHLFGREIDLVSARALEENPNPAYRRQILGSARQIYAA
jgi:predicted nucleotidyltransferase